MHVLRHSHKKPIFRRHLRSGAVEPEDKVIAEVMAEPVGDRLDRDGLQFARDIAARAERPIERLDAAGEGEAH